jgi:transcriptional regulator with XRE-family HTH domain
MGRARAAYLARRLGIALRERRLAARLSQRELAGRAGVSQQEVSRLERGTGMDARLLTWAAVGGAAGLELAAFFEQAPGADLPRDIEHLRRQNLILALSVRGGWTGMPEAALSGDGPRPRSIDVLLERRARREVAVVEIWDLLLDGGAAMRGLEAKVLATRARQGEGWHVEGLIVVRGTRRNRALVRDLGQLFAARYPASSAAWLEALADPQVPLPQAGGFAWTDVAGSRLLAARIGGPPVARPPTGGPGP